MNAAVVHSFNVPPRYTSFDDPVVSENETLVNVSAAALHPIVKTLANGTHYGSTGKLPFIPGVDGVGHLEDGGRVYFGIARPPYGSFAERTVASRKMLVSLPDGLDDVTAAAIANPAMSSMVALEARAKFVAGESVLVLGATGVAGQLAVQIAKRLGARRVVAAGRNPAALERLKDLGAEVVISLEQEHVDVVSAFRKEITGAGVDVVLDYLWGQPAEYVLEAIAQKGLDHAAPRIRFIQIGSSAGLSVPLQAATLRSSGVELLGSGFGSASLEQIQQAVVEFFQSAAKDPYHFETQVSPLRDVEILWGGPERGKRLVFKI